MQTLPSEKTPIRPMGSFEFGRLMLLAVFVVPLAVHILASLAA